MKADAGAVFTADQLGRLPKAVRQLANRPTLSIVRQACARLAIDFDGLAISTANKQRIAEGQP